MFGYSIPHMTPLSFALLRLIADGEFHSGAALARALHVTRGTIWNAVRALEAVELCIYKVRGRGYKLAERVSLLDAAAISRFAGARAEALRIELVDTAESTNTQLMQRAQAGAPSGSVLAAEWQQRGRGRMGRQWQAGLARGIAFSMLWRSAQAPSALAGLSLAIGVAVIRTLRELGATGAQLKWPNDVLWKSAKLAGILVELQGDALGPSAVVIGIGVNVRLSDAMKSRIDQPAVDLETACGFELDRNAVLGALLRHLADVLDAFAAEGFAPLREEWERYHAHQGRRVTVTLPNGAVDSGVARGIGDDGALLFQSGNALRRLHSGEISLRAAAAGKRPRAVRRA